MKKKALGYARMSTLEQDASIERQERDLQEWCARDGFDLTLFADRGITAHGKKRNDRPQWRKLLDHIESGRAKADGYTELRVWKFDRIARNLVDKIVVLGRVEEAGIRVNSLRDPEPEDSKSRFIVRAVGGMVDQLYSESVAEHVTGGMRNAAAKGRWVYGHAPYGYVARDGVLHVDEARPERAEAVRLAYAMSLAGDGCHQIALTFTRRGILPPCRDDMQEYRVRAEHVWAAKHVRNILMNRVYLGEILFAGKVEARGAHPALVDEVTFERAQRAMTARRRQRRTGNPVRQGKPSLFTPWARCGICGGPMRIQPGGSKNKPHDYLMCTRRIDNRDACTGINVRTDVLDPKLLTAIQDRLMTPVGVRTMIAASIERLSATGDVELLAQRRAVEDRIRVATAAIGRLMKALASGAVEESDIADEVRRLKDVRDAARDELADLPVPAPIPSIDEVDADAFRQGVCAAFSEGTVEERRRALALLVERVELHPGEAVLHYRWGGLDAKNQGHTPFGPPEGSAPVKRGWVGCGEVSPPKRRIGAELQPAR